MYRLVIFSLLSLCVLYAGAQSTCSGDNPINGLTYNLTRMIRTSAQPDYNFIVDPNNGTSYTVYFVNICSPTRELCSGSGVCLENLPIATYQSLGNSSAITWSAYQPNSAENGITLQYSGGEVCQNTTYTTNVNVLCDNTVSDGEIDSVVVNGCVVNVNMRSTFGCGFNETSTGPSQCSKYVTPSSSCTSTTSSFSCQSKEKVSLSSPGALIFNISQVTNYTIENNNGIYENGYDDSIHGQVYGGIYYLQFTLLNEKDENTQVIPNTTFNLTNFDWTVSAPQATVSDDADCTLITTVNSTATSTAVPWTITVTTTISGANPPRLQVFIDNYVFNPSGNSISIQFTLQSLGAVQKLRSENDTSVENLNVMYSISPFGYDASNEQVVTSFGMIDSDTDGLLQISLFNQSILVDSELSIKYPDAPQANVASLCSGMTCNVNSDFSVTLQGDAGISIKSSSGSSSVIVLRSIQEATISSEMVYSANNNLYLEDLDWVLDTPSLVIAQSGQQELQFSWHLSGQTRFSNLSVTCTVSPQNGISHLTIDVKMEGYQWMNPGPSTLLQLELDIITSGSISYSYSTVVVGSTYVNLSSLLATSTSSTGTQLLPVSLSYDSAALVSVPYFTGTLEKQIIVGINTTSDTPTFISTAFTAVDGVAGTGDDNEGTDRWVIWLIVTLSVLGLVSILLAVLLFFVIRKRSLSYEEL